MAWIKKIKDRLRAFFLTPSAGHALSALRIVIGGAMLIEAVRVFPYIDQLYGQYGYIQADLIEALTGAALPGFLEKAGWSAAGYSKALTIFYVIHIGLVLMFLIGWKSVYANVGLWLSQTVLINSGYLSSYGVDRYFHNLLFLMIWFPVAQTWSLDRWLHGQPFAKTARARVGLRLIQIFMLMTYLNAGLAKSKGADWWSGESIWRAMNQPEFHHFNFLWLAQVPWLARLMSRATMFIEVFYSIGVWIPIVGPLWVLAIIGMHLGIALTMGLTLFGVTLAFVNAAIFLVHEPSKGAL